MPSEDLTRIARNIDTLSALNSLQDINKNLAIHQTRLVTGRHLDESWEDPSGYNIACIFDTRCHDLKSAVYTIGDVKNLISTMESGIKRILNILVKMYNKAIEASSDTIDENQRTAINDMVQDFIAEIDAVVTNTQWNGMALISGTGSFSFLGFSSNPEGNSTRKTFFMTALDPVTLGVDSLNVKGFKGSGANIATAISAIHDAINKAKSAISDVAEFNAQLRFMEEVLSLTHANTKSTYNRIKNANMADEQVGASKLLILQQASTAMLAQANMTPQFLLSIFS